jgi:hypothetical protein
VSDPRETGKGRVRPWVGASLLRAMRGVIVPMPMFRRGTERMRPFGGRLGRGPASRRAMLIERSAMDGPK